MQKRRKHIAYVAPESHHSNSVMDGELSSTTEGEAEDEPHPAGLLTTADAGHRLRFQSGDVR